MLPAGWNTYVGTAIQILGALTMFLQYLTGHADPASLAGSMGLMGTGHAISSSGQAKQSTVVKGIALQEKLPVEATQQVLSEKK